MGRLTLNVLLSFAQFEREVTGERIRDKIAASKAKGLWMGGTVPFGYDADGRTLKVNEKEANTVRSIYQRYLELKSVPLLYDELEKQGIKSRVRLSASCRQTGGTAIARGALTHILQNRIYLGEITHRERIHKGQHKAIVSQASWDKVQDTFKNNRFARKLTNTPAVDEYWLSGKLFDSGGRPYTPTYTSGRHGKHYHYYAVQRLRGGKLRVKSGVERVPRDLIHHLVAYALPQYGNAAQGEAAQFRADNICRVTLHSERLIIETEIPDTEGNGRIEVEYRVAVRGERSEILPPPTYCAPITPSDQAFLKAARRAWQWRVALEHGKYESVNDLAEAEGFARPYVNKMLRLAFLLPTELGAQAVRVAGLA